MYKKPLLFIILACAHMIEPLIKIIYFKLSTSFSFHTVITNISQAQSLREVFDFWFLFPIGGLALISVKKWSYPIFVGVQAYSIYAHLTYEKYSWPYMSEMPFVSSLALLFMNALIIVYFALPHVRRPFFDRSLRWWETKKRYPVRIPVSFTIKGTGENVEGDILNISQTGVFISSDLDFNVNTPVELTLNYKEFQMSIDGLVRSRHSFQEEHGLGIKFKFRNIWENLHMRKLVKEISRDVHKIERHRDQRGEDQKDHNQAA